MNHAAAPAAPSAQPGQHTAAGAQLHGYQLLAVRAAWLIVAIVSVALFVASIPPYYADLLALSGPHMEAPDSVRAGLGQLGIPLGVYATYTTAVMVALAAAFVGVGAVIVWRKPDDRSALFFSLTLVVFGAIWPNTLDSLESVHPGLELITAVLETWGFASFLLLFYLFPDGRFVPGWTRWAALVLVVELVLAEHFPDFPLGADTWPALLSIPFYVGLLGSTIMAPIYRYRRVSGSLQRQQLKWVTYSLVVALVSFTGIGSLSGIPTLNQPGVPAALYALSGPVAFGLVFMLVPVSIGIAVLRYRLWDIDPIINRTLVYGALTAIVVGLYILTVGYLGAIFRADDNMLFSLAATGLVAVLFQPLRDRLQRGVNRLMYGERDEPYRVIPAWRAVGNSADAWAGAADDRRLCERCAETAVRCRCAAASRGLSCGSGRWRAGCRPAPPAARLPARDRRAVDPQPARAGRAVRPGRPPATRRSGPPGRYRGARGATHS